MNRKLAVAAALVVGAGAASGGAAIAAGGDELGLCAVPDHTAIPGKYAFGEVASNRLGSTKNINAGHNTAVPRFLGAFLAALARRVLLATSAPSPAFGRSRTPTPQRTPAGPGAQHLSRGPPPNGSSPRPGRVGHDAKTAVGP